MQLLDPYPIAAIVVGFVVITLLCYEVGFRLGRWWQARMPGEQEGPTGVLIGSVLGLLAFLLAVTMGMAAERFDARRNLVPQEANAIGKAYLLADYLPEPQTEELRALLREYVPLRISSSDLAQVQANIVTSEVLHGEMWAITAAVARTGHNPDLMSSLGEAVTDIVSLHETRIVAGLYARVPETVVLLLLGGSALGLGLVGYGAGLAGRRSVISAVITTVVLGTVLALVIDLDRPQEGVLQVSQQALLDVQRRITPPSP